MKARLINFAVGMGIPVSGITTQGAGCSGICGSCAFSCAPGVLAVLLLLCKAAYKRLRTGGMRHGQAG